MVATGRFTAATQIDPRHSSDGTNVHPHLIYRSLGPAHTSVTQMASPLVCLFLQSLELHAVVTNTDTHRQSDTTDRQTTLLQLVATDRICDRH